jgi:arginine/ornithine transport system permease protein
MEDERGPSLLEAIKDFSENASPVDFVIIAQHWEMFLTGVGYTLLIVVVSLVVGGALSLPLAVARAYRTPIVNQIIWVYVYVFRGTPLLVQLYLIYYGLGQFEAVRDSFIWPVLRDPLWCTLISFVLNTAAYTTEIFRGAIEAIPYGEVEAAKACGMSNWLRTTRIVLPNALRRALPAYSNEIIFMVHGSVVASTVTIVDILGAGRILNAKYYLAYEGFLAAAALYMILVLFITRGFKLWEKHWHAHLRPREA